MSNLHLDCTYLQFSSQFSCTVYLELDFNLLYLILFLLYLNLLHLQDLNYHLHLLLQDHLLGVPVLLLPIHLLGLLGRGLLGVLLLRVMLKAVVTPIAPFLILSMLMIMIMPSYHHDYSSCCYHYLMIIPRPSYHQTRMILH